MASTGSDHHEPMVVARREHCLILCTQDINEDPIVNMQTHWSVGAYDIEELKQSCSVTLSCCILSAMVHAFSTFTFNSVDTRIASSDRHRVTTCGFYKTKVSCYIDHPLCIVAIIRECQKRLRRNMCLTIVYGAWELAAHCLLNPDCI